MRVVESGFAALDCSDEDKARKLAGNTSGRPPKLRDREEYARGAGAVARRAAGPPTMFSRR